MESLRVFQFTVTAKHASYGDDVFTHYIQSDDFEAAQNHIFDNYKRAEWMIQDCAVKELYVVKI